MAFIRDHASHQRRHKADNFVSVAGPYEPFFCIGSLLFAERTSSLEGLPLSRDLSMFAEEVLAQAVVEKVADTVEEAQFDNVGISFAAVPDTVLSFGVCWIKHVQLCLGLEVKEILRAQLQRDE